MMTTEEIEFMTDYLKGLSAEESKDFKQVSDFILADPGSGKLLTQAKDAGKETWGEAYEFMLQSHYG